MELVRRFEPTENPPFPAGFSKRMMGLELTPFCMASRAEGVDTRRRTTTIGRNHAGLLSRAAGELAWHPSAVSAGLWHECGHGEFEPECDLVELTRTESARLEPPPLMLLAFRVSRKFGERQRQDQVPQLACPWAMH